MSKDKSAGFIRPLFISSSDPLRIKSVALGGAPPSLRVEAQIATKQWAINNESVDMVKEDVESKEKS